MSPELDFSKFISSLKNTLFPAPFSPRIRYFLEPAIFAAGICIFTSLYSLVSSVVLIEEIISSLATSFSQPSIICNSFFLISETEITVPILVFNSYIGSMNLVL